jgi:hypothetical protein
MATFRNEKKIDAALDQAGLQEVAADVANHFEGQEYEAESIPLEDKEGWMVSITRGGFFRTVLGQKTALNVSIWSTADGTNVDADVGLFKSQAIPSLITVFIFWPVILGQIWGLVKESKLDNEAVKVAERSIRAHATTAGAVPA